MYCNDCLVKERAFPVSSRHSLCAEFLRPKDKGWILFEHRKSQLLFFSYHVSRFFQDPDVPVADWIPVILQVDASLTGVFLQLYLVVDNDTVVPDGHD